MKTYTFTLPKTTDNAKKYKNSLIERVITAYPWLTIDSSFDFPKSDFGIENAIAGDMITLGISPTHNVSWKSSACKNCPFANSCLKDSVNFDLETEFIPAMNALKTYAFENFPFKKDYDFEDEFGTPIKIFDNFVQIGYEIIPIKHGSLNYLKPKTKKLIIDIVIKIKKNGWY